MNQLTVFNFDSNAISFRNVDGVIMMNANEMSRPFEKRPYDFLQLASTRNYLEELSKTRNTVLDEFVKVVKGGANPGTWMHEDVAMEFARWLSPSFAIWCNYRIKELLRHGATAMNPEDLLNPDFIINLATALKTERAEKEKFQAITEIQAKELKEAAPKVEYHNKVMQSESLIATNVIAKELGMSAVTLNKTLQSLKIIYQSNGTWVLYHQYQDKGYTGTKTYHYTDSIGKDRTQVQTYWTEKGRQFIHIHIAKLTL